MFIIEQITDNILNTLKGLNLYGGIPTVECERIHLEIDDRFPFITLIGPFTTVEPNQSQIDNNLVYYGVKYYIDENDEDKIIGNELPFRTRNVGWDILKGLMNDETRGGFAQCTQVETIGHAIELLSDMAIFFVYVTFIIKMRTAKTDPSIMG